MTSYDNGLNDNDYNDYNDDNANDNVVVAGAPLPNFCLLFLFLFKALHPATEHPAYLVECFLKSDVFLLVDGFYVKG